MTARLICRRHCKTPPHDASTVALQTDGVVGAVYMKVVAPVSPNEPHDGKDATEKLKSGHVSSGEESTFVYCCPT